jgi:integrase
MARTTKPLTHTQIKQAKARSKEYNLADGGGLALRVKPTGTKLWLLNYPRPYTGKRTNMALGAYPEVSLAEAREKREAARKLLAKDIDPKEKRDEDNHQLKLAHNNTLEHIATAWFNIKKKNVTPNYAEDIWRSLELHIFPKLGNRPLHKVTAPMAIEALEPVAAKGSLETVKRVCQRLNEMMVWATNTGVIHHNPLAGISKAFHAPEKSNQPTLKPEQLPAFLSALQAANLRTTTRCLILWQLHTMARPSEAAGARWNEINEDEALWHIPAERMKKKRAHTVPLTPQTIELLERMKPISSRSEYIFPSDRLLSKPTNPQTANAAIKRMGYAGQLVAHGLRSIASTTLNEENFDADVIEVALSHVEANEVRGAYNRAQYLKRRGVMMTWWSNHIEQAATYKVQALASKGFKAVG